MRPGFSFRTSASGCVRVGAGEASAQRAPMKSEFVRNFRGGDEFDDFAWQTRGQAGERELVILDLIAPEIQSAILADWLGKGKHWDTSS